MKKRIILGIDPGMQGGIAVYANRKTIVVKMVDSHTVNSPPKGVEGWVFIEKIGMYRGEGESNPGKAMQMQKLFARTQQLIGRLIELGYQVVEVPPVTWQAYLNLKGAKGEIKKDRKNRYKQYAQACHPDLKVVLWNADALLLAQFGRLKLQQDMGWINGRILKG